MVPDVRISQFSAAPREESSYREMETATVEALQRVIREYEHQQDCQRIALQVQILGATREEEEAAREVVHKAPLALPIGAERRELKNS